MVTKYGLMHIRITRGKPSVETSNTMAKNKVQAFGYEDSNLVIISFLNNNNSYDGIRTLSSKLLVSTA
jgi:hypothetical protein